MKFLAICRPRDGGVGEQFAALVPDEAAALRDLRSRGILREAWSPGRPGAVLVLETGTESDAAQILSQLPLSVAGLLDIEIVPLRDLGV